MPATNHGGTDPKTRSQTLLCLSMSETMQAVNSVQAFTIFHQNQSSPQGDQHENKTIIWSTQTHTSSTSRVTAPAVSGSKSFMSNHSHRLGPYENNISSCQPCRAMLADLAATQACRQRSMVTLTPKPTDVKAHTTLLQHVKNRASSQL